MKRDPFQNLDAQADALRPTRRCSLCGAHEGPRRELRARQFIAAPVSQPRTPTGEMRWRATVDFACPKCRKGQPDQRVPSYHPDGKAAPFQIYASQLVADCRVITLNEPWAWLISQGFKDCENRSWSSKFTGRIFIHAGKRMAADYERIEHFVGVHLGILLPDREWVAENHLGRIVGVAEFGTMQPYLDSPWKIKGQWAWPIKWARAIEPTAPIRGALGLWRAPSNLALRLMEGQS